MLNVLITGGCGFIGSNFLNYMVTKYPNINFYNLDCLYYCASLRNITVSDKSNHKFNDDKKNITLNTLREFLSKQ